MAKVLSTVLWQIPMLAPVAVMNERADLKAPRPRSWRRKLLYGLVPILAFLLVAEVVTRLLRDPTRFRAWFHSVIVSVHRGRCRKGWWRRWVGDDDETVEPIGDDGSRWIDQRASADRASRALATLRPAQREAIVLFELHGHSLEEIAEIQRTSLSSVKSRLVRGRERLRRFYAELGSDLDREGSPEPRAVTHEEGCHG